MDIKKIKTNKQSEVYQIGIYKVTLKTPIRNKSLKKNELGTYYYNGDIEFDEVSYVECRVMLVENMITGKCAQKTVYQNDPITDFARDINRKIQFKEIFAKIDSQ